MVREAKLEDDESIKTLGKLLNSNYDNLFKLKNILSDKFNKVYVYVINDLIIGFIHIIELDETIEIINIVIDPNYRHQGIGSSLISHIIENAKYSVKEITLEVSSDNSDAINFYSKHEFKIINVRKCYYDGKDGYLMGRSIKWTKIFIF